MKDFIKYTLASLLGVVLAGIVLTVLGIITLAGMLGSSSTEPTVKEKTVFTLKLEGEIAERANELPLASLLSSEYESIGLNDVLSAIQKAKEHKNIEGIFLKAGLVSATPATLEEIRNALITFKESGKFLVVYADSYTQGLYYVASVADKIVLNPEGSLSWKGLSVQTLYLKEAMAKLGVKMEVFKVGSYKSAVEPFTATEMSAENREQLTAYTQSIWKQMVTGVSEARGIPVDTLNQYANELMDFESANRYVACNLVDTLLYKEGMMDYLKELTATGAKDRLRSLNVSEMNQVNAKVPKDKSGNTIAIYYATGTIDGGDSSVEGIDSDKTIKQLRKLREEESVKAVILRIDSPGGSAYGSEQIWQEVKALRAKKPVVVSMGGYAASGGYYIASAANHIVAHPTTLTGSIGIFGMIPNAQELLTKKLGLHFDAVNTHAFSDVGSMGRSFKPEERVALQQMIERGYETFISRCAEGRDLSTSAIEQVAEGRIWSGEMAKEQGLVDELGGINEAIDWAVKQADITAYTLQSYPEQESFVTKLLNSKDKFLHSELKKRMGTYYNTLHFMQNITNVERVQARLPFELIIE
ncbi:MAG: signal peptide peptidase SppA [Phocaeicola sp.]